MVLLLSKLYLPRIQRGLLFSRGGGGLSNFFVSGEGGGPNANFFRIPYTYLLFSRGGYPDPLSPSGSAHGQCHHNGTNIYHSPASNHNCQALICQD